MFCWLQAMLSNEHMTRLHEFDTHSTLHHSWGEGDELYRFLNTYSRLSQRRVLLPTVADYPAGKLACWHPGLILGLPWRHRREYVWYWPNPYQCIWKVVIGYLLLWHEVQGVISYLHFPLFPLSVEYGIVYTGIMWYCDSVWQLQ